MENSYATQLTPANASRQKRKLSVKPFGVDVQPIASTQQAMMINKTDSLVSDYGFSSLNLAAVDRYSSFLCE
jgi:hypothetical protein